MINEQIDRALSELLKLNFGCADITGLFSCRNNSNDKMYRYEYSLHEDFADHKMKNFISAVITDHAVRNDCVVMVANGTIRVERKVHLR